MVVCLCADHFITPGGVRIHLAARRLHDQKDQRGKWGNKAFVFQRDLPGQHMSFMKSFNTYRELLRYYGQQVVLLVDQGYRRIPVVIMGWHEEG